MPNWTDITLTCEGISDLPIFTEYNGKKELDYNKIVPMPDYIRNTISPMRTNAVLNYLFTEFSEEEARAKVKKLGIEVDKDLLKKSAEEIVSETSAPEYLGFGDNAEEISAYDLGKNYVTAIEETGTWEWYDWAYSNWGVKWNASDTTLYENNVSFFAPWGYPDKIFEKLAEMFPDKRFYAEIIYEDEFDSIHTIDFSANHWEEGTEINPAYIEETFDNLEFKLGLYNQRNAAYPEEMEESKAFGIAIDAYDEGEPYAMCTVNLPNLYGDFCEMIGIKNSAYMDTNNYPWVTQFIADGIAVDTGFTKRSGLCEYPLYQFNEEWLRSLKPVVEDRTYNDYERKYNKAMGIETEENNLNVDSIKKEYPSGTKVVLHNMEGEDRMPSGLKGVVTSVDDIGQIHVKWENGSTLALNSELDSFSIDNSKEKDIELAIRPLKPEERDYTYTQEQSRLKNSGCIGHLRVDMDTNGKGFYTSWDDHSDYLKTDHFKTVFDTIINALRDPEQYDGILTDRESLRKYCNKNPESCFADDTNDDHHINQSTFGFRVDSDTYSLMLRLDPSPGMYAAYIYAYDKGMLDDHLEEMANREKITVVMVEPGKPPYTKEIFNDLESSQKEVGGLIECVYPWEDDAGIVCNEEGKIMGLPLNRAMRDEDGNIYDIIAGTFFVTGLTDDGFGSLTPEQVVQYMDMFKEPETIIRLNGELKAFPTSEYSQVPVYMQNGEYARENGELEAYRASFRANVACKKAIEEALSEHYSYETYCLDSDAAYKDVVEQFGADRVNMVLANTCNHKDWDARITDTNKEWANTIPVPNGKDGYGDDMTVYYICEKPHIGLVNMLCDNARKGFEKEIEKPKESVKKKLDEAKAKVSAPVAKTNKEKDKSI